VVQAFRAAIFRWHAAVPFPTFAFDFVLPAVAGQRDIEDDLNRVVLYLGERGWDVAEPPTFPSQAGIYPEYPAGIRIEDQLALFEHHPF